MHSKYTGHAKDWYTMKSLNIPLHRSNSKLHPARLQQLSHHCFWLSCITSKLQSHPSAKLPLDVVAQMHYDLA